MSDEPGSAGPGDAESERLLRLLGGKWVAAAVSAAATLRIPDALAEGPLDLADLAERIDADPAALERLLRVLVGEGVLREDAGGAYALTPLGQQLRRDRLGELARMVGAPFGWDPWSALADSVRTGASAFHEHHGRSLFDYLDHHADEARLYHAAIESFTRHEAVAVAQAFDFSQARRVADVGGGRGALLVEILTRWPHLEGVLLERPPAVEEARKVLAEAGLERRCEARVGDFFEAVPADADVCILMHIVHSWDDATATALLRRCGDAVGPDGTVLVVEGVVAPMAGRDLTNLLDLEMLVLCGPGQERRKPELRRLFSAAGLQLVSVEPLPGRSRLFIARPRRS